MANDKIRIVTYTTEYKDRLEVLLKEFSQELFGTGTVNIEDYVSTHWCVYLAVVGEDVVGVASFTYNTYFGMRKPTVGLTYLYVTPKYRNTKANYLLNLQSGVLSITNNLPLEHHYASDQSKRMSRKVNGKKVYETWVVEVEDVMTAFNRLKSKVKIKDI